MGGNLRVAQCCLLPWIFFTWCPFSPAHFLFFQFFRFLLSVLQTVLGSSHVAVSTVCSPRCPHMWPQHGPAPTAALNNRPQWLLGNSLRGSASHIPLNLSRSEVGVFLSWLSSCLSLSKSDLYCHPHTLWLRRWVILFHSAMNELQICSFCASLRFSKLRIFTHQIYSRLSRSYPLIPRFFPSTNWCKQFIVSIHSTYHSSDKKSLMSSHFPNRRDKTSLLHIINLFVGANMVA